jgi:hypothetical protein
VLNDPAHWRQRAEEARAMAEVISDPGAKQTMLRVAAGYEEMARKAERRILTQPSSTGKNP